MQDAQDVHVWPENVAFVEFFASLGPGAWQTGMNGRTGIRYECLPFVLEMRKVKRKRWPEFYDAICIMEGAALEAMRGTD